MCFFTHLLALACAVIANLQAEENISSVGRITDDGAIQVPARIGASNLRHLVLDTGSDITVIHSKLATNLDVARDGVYLARHGRDIGPLSSYTCQLRFPHHGDPRNAKVLAIDLGRYDGILSMRDLPSTAIVANYDTDSVKLVGDKFEPAEFGLSHRLPLLVKRRTMPDSTEAISIWCLLEVPHLGLQLFQIDTGASESSLVPHLSNALAITGELEIGHLDVMMVFFESLPSGVLQKIRLGNEKYEDMNVTVGDSDSNTVGVDLLRRMNWALGLTSGFYYKRRADFHRKPARTDLFGLRFGHRTIQYIIDDSPAVDVGLRVGDVIASVSGMKIEDDDSLSKLLSQFKEGDIAELTVERGENTHVYSVTARDYFRPWSKADHLNDLRKASAKSAQAAVILGWLHEKSRLELKPERALEYYERAVKSKDPKAWYLLAEISLIEGRHQHAKMLYQGACKRGLPEAFLRLGDLLSDPASDVFDRDFAIAAYQKAKELGWVGIPAL